MEVKMKTVVAIGLLGLCIPFALIQSRRGVSENRVDGQMDSDVAVNLPGAGKKKKPKIQNVVDASGMTQSPSESSDFAPKGEPLNTPGTSGMTQVGSELRVTAMSATGVAHTFGAQGSLLHTNSSINQSNQSKSAPQEESLEDKGAAAREVNLDMIREKLRTTMQRWISNWLTGDVYCVKEDQVAEAKVVKEKLDELETMVKEYKQFLKGPKGTSKEALDKSKKLMDKVNTFQYCESAFQAKCYFVNKQNCTENTPAVDKDLMAVFEGSGDKSKSMPTILLQASMMAMMTMKHSTQWDAWSEKSGCALDISNATFVAWATDFGCTDNCKDPALNQDSLPPIPEDTLKSCTSLIVPGSANWKMGCDKINGKLHGTTKCDKSESYPVCCCQKDKFFTKDFSATGCKAKCSETPASDINFHWYTQQRLKLVLDKVFNAPGKECDYRAKYQASSIGPTKRLSKGVWIQLGKLLRALFEKRLFTSAAGGVSTMVDEMKETASEVESEVADIAEEILNTDDPTSLLELADLIDAGGEDSEILTGLLVLLIIGSIVSAIIAILIIRWIARNFDDIMAGGLLFFLFVDD